MIRAFATKVSKFLKLKKSCDSLFNQLLNGTLCIIDFQIFKLDFKSGLFTKRPKIFIKKKENILILYNLISMKKLRN
jgi:hypothetical protein